MQKQDQKQQEQNIDYVIYAMASVVHWNDLYEFCQERSSCMGCPYKSRLMCERESTLNVMKRAAEIFRDFLDI